MRGPEMAAKQKRLTGEERRKEIIRAAMDVFSRNGFSGSTTRKIAERAGISEAMIYSHFQNKEDLYAAIIDEKFKNTESLFYPVEAMRNKDDRQAFTSIISSFLHHHSGDTTFIRLLLFSALEGHELAHMFVAGPMTRFFAFLAEYIQQRCDDGAFRPTNPQLAARSLLGMVVYFVLLREIYGDQSLQSLSPEETIDAIVTLFCEGIQQPVRHTNNPETPL
jgi:AcrR family transcriptional regulator